MQPFNSDDLARMQATQEAAMQDTCQLLRREEVGTDDYGYKHQEFAVVMATLCGFHPTATKEVMDGAEVALTDAQVRLPLSLHAEVGNLDRIKITHRFGVELTDQPVYEVIGEAKRGPSGLVLNLRLVTEGSG
jgi:hypothetical protein